MFLPDTSLSVENSTNSLQGRTEPSLSLSPEPVVEGGWWLESPGCHLWFVRSSSWPGILQSLAGLDDLQSVRLGKLCSFSDLRPSDELRPAGYFSHTNITLAGTRE